MLVEFKRVVVVLSILTFSSKLWGLGGNDISQEERERMQETQFKAYPLSEWIGITEEIQKITFTMKIHRTSSRYRVAILFPDINRDNKDEILGTEIAGKSVKTYFAEMFSLVIEDVKTGRVIYWYNLKPFRYGNMGSAYLWGLKSRLKFRRNREYRVHLTLPGIKDTPQELKRIKFLCNITHRPSL